MCILDIMLPVTATRSSGGRTNYCTVFPELTHCCPVVVSGAGDLVSPGMFEDHLTSLNTAWAYHDSGEGYVYEFAVNLQTLNYLQTINLLDDDTLNTALEYMQTSK